MGRHQPAVREFQCASQQPLRRPGLLVHKSILKTTAVPRISVDAGARACLCNDLLIAMIDLTCRH